MKILSLMTSTVLLMVAFALSFSMNLVAAAPEDVYDNVDTSDRTLSAGGGCDKNYALGVIVPWYKYMDDCSGEGSPLTVGTDSGENGWMKLLAVGIAVLESTLGVAVVLAVFFFMFGAIKLIISSGTPDKIAEARSAMQNALLGLVLAVMSRKIVELAGNTVTSNYAAGTAIPMRGLIQLLIIGGVGLAVLFIGKAALTFAISGGNTERVASARKTILYAVLGLFLLVSAYSIIGITISIG